MLLNEKRLILVGGKGGVGKTTMSAALAVLASQHHKKVLVVSTDPAHSLADAFGRAPIGDQITAVAPAIDAIELDPDKEVEQHLAKVSAQLKRFAQPQMFTEIERQLRLTRLSPGAQEAALLERLSTVIELGMASYDRVIVDTAPTGHTLRLLTLPEAMAAWTQGLLNANQRSQQLGEVFAHLTPNAGKAIDNPLINPSEHATAGMDARNKAIAETLLQRQRLLQRTRETFLDGSQTAMLFVLTPEKLPILETERAVKTLVAENLPLAGLIINRVLPDSADGEFLAQRRQTEQQHLAHIAEIFAALPRYPVALQPTDIHGLAALHRLAGQLADTGLWSI